MSLQPRTVLITGSSSGIGRAIAERLLDKGHRVVGQVVDHTSTTLRHWGSQAPCSLDIR